MAFILNEVLTITMIVISFIVLGWKFWLLDIHYVEMIVLNVFLLLSFRHLKIQNTEFKWKFITFLKIFGALCIFIGCLEFFVFILSSSARSHLYKDSLKDILPIVAILTLLNATSCLIIFCLVAKTSEAGRFRRSIAYIVKHQQEHRTLSHGSRETEHLDMTSNTNTKV